MINIESVTISSLSTNYEKTWDFINSNFLGKYEGYLRVRHDGNIRYLDYVKQYGNVSNQVIRFGENLLDLKKYSKAEDIKTAIIPVGKDNVTITTANGHNGTDYVYSQDAVDLYGWIYDKVDFSEVYDPDKLLEEANKYLQKCINLAITIELTAVDLHMIDVDINAIRLGDLVPCISTQHGIMSTFGNPDTYYLVSKYELDLENPANNKITLGRTISTLTDKQVQSSQNLETKINEVRTEMYNISGNDIDKVHGKGLSTNDYTTAEKTKLAGIVDGANKYVHPTSSGNKHIPSGGSSGQILRWGADGTAVWGSDNNTTYADATQSTHGLMSTIDKKKLDAYPTYSSIQSTYATKSEITNMYKYCGSAASADKLPTTGQRVGDVYNIETASTYGGAGMNVAWNGSAWDPLGEIFSISTIANTWMDTNLT